MKKIKLLLPLFFSTLLLRADEDEQSINIKELYYKGEFSPKNIYEIGRMNVKEGVGRGYNPSDFFKGSTSLTLSSDPKEIRENRLGSVMVQNTLFFDDFTLKSIYSPKISVDADGAWGGKKEYEKLDETWEKIMQFAGKNRLLNDDFYAYAIAYDNPDISNNNRLRYDACVSATKEIKLKNQEIRAKVLDGGKYAVFLHKGKHSDLTHTYDAIFGNWLYESSISLRDVPLFQRFLNNKPKLLVEKR